ncbi:MAG TPA: AAA family ATPase [Actinomycetota bacterium]|jgi:AAA+ superfamily predicted ATPase|nr:AAA family ATPase [Actinomycetota bacterium]
MDSTADLRLLLASRHPLIVAEMDDEVRFMEILRRAAVASGVPVWTWSATQGLRRDGMGQQAGTTDARVALAFIAQIKDSGLFIMNDLRPFLSDNQVVRLIKEISQLNLPGQTIVLTGSSAEVPPELHGIALPWTLEPPGRDEVEAEVRRTIGDLSARKFAVALDDKQVDGLVEAVRGLTLPEAERLIVRAALADGKLEGDDVAEVREAKAELLETDGVLELIPAESGSLDNVGGMDNLKAWLAVRGRGFEPAAKQFGLDPPRGVLLTGVPGCGKSLVAKTLARTWGLPLVLLDPGSIYGSYVGESEARLRSALNTVEAMAPVVLWLDEIEKGFAAGTGAGDSGVSQRVLGAFLHWMQERPPGVFLVATSNDVERLPPELLRRGRFDEIFFVDLPNQTEREAIFRLHLSKRKRDPAVFDLALLGRASGGFSGAEIEGAIVGAMYRAFAAGSDVATETMLEELAQTTPLSRTRAEDVAAMRAWSRGRATPATTPDPS